LTALYRRTVFDPVFTADVHICIGPYDEFCEMLRKTIGDDADNNRKPAGKTVEHQFEGQARSKEWYLWFPSAATASHTVAHECLHVTARVLMDRGVKLSLDSEETYTYYLSSLVREVEKSFTLYKRRSATATKKRKKHGVRAAGATVHSRSESLPASTSMADAVSEKAMRKRMHRASLRELSPGWAEYVAVSPLREPRSRN
jgi:hypothetical protein